MPKESERKFLMRGDAWRRDSTEAHAIRQFYLVAASDRSLRVRLKNGQAMLTLKLGAASRERDEYEYALSLSEARDMERFAVGRPIEKTRHLVPHRGHVYEIDVFSGDLAGLVIAELETPEEVAAADLPSWIGKEVTGVTAFYNASLALNGKPETAE